MTGGSELLKTVSEGERSTISILLHIQDLKKSRLDLAGCFLLGVSSLPLGLDVRLISGVGEFDFRSAFTTPVSQGSVLGMLTVGVSLLKDGENVWHS
jgi:hypothetical protein